MYNLPSYYEKLPKQVKASFWYMMTQILKRTIGLLIIPLYTRMLTTAEYGIYSIFNSWLEILLVFATLKIYGNGFNVGMAKFSDDRDCYTSSMAGLGFAIAGVFCSVMFIFRDPFSSILELPYPLIILLGIELALDTPYNLWAAVQRYDYKYKTNTLLTVSAAILTPVIGVPLVLCIPNKAAGAILGKSLPAILLGVICTIFLFKKNKSFFVKKYWKYALAFNLPLIFYYLSQTVLHQMDKLMIRQFVGESAVGIYSVAVSAAGIISFVAGAVNSSLIPYIFQNMKMHREAKVRVVTDEIIIGMAVVYLCVIMVAPEAMKLFASEDYQKGVWLIGPLVAGLFLNFVYQMYCNVEFYYEKKYYLMAASIGVCICNFLMNYCFISQFGYFAAAYTTLASHLVCGIFHLLFVHKILHKEKAENPLDSWFMAGVSIFFVALAGGLMLLYDFLIIRYGIIFMIAVFVFTRKKAILEVVGKIKDKEEKI